MGCSDPEDPLYLRLQRPEAVGPAFRLPTQWLPGAKSVLSFFFPFTEAVRKSNRGGAEPSALWLHGRIEGQRFLTRFAAFLVDALEAQGIRAVAPSLSEDFQVNDVRAGEPFGSNWSERHVAYISGLGTFSLSKGIITEKGMAGRLISLVTNAALPPTPRAYTELYEYCILCGACARRCPVGAIVTERGMEAGKAHRPARTTRMKWPGASPPATAAASVRWASPARTKIPPRFAGNRARRKRRKKEPGEGSPGSFCMGLLFQLAGGGGGEVGVDEAVQIAVHDGGDVAVFVAGAVVLHQV